MTHDAVLFRHRQRLFARAGEVGVSQPAASALGHPGLGPRRISAQLALPEWGGQPISAIGVYKTLRRHGLNLRIRRLSLVAVYASPPVPEPQPPTKRLHLEAEHPGDLVQLDCFHIGHLTGTKGRVWQYTATDVASSFVWAEVHRDDGANPAAQYTSALAHRVADELATAGWKPKAVLTDNGQVLGLTNPDHFGSPKVTSPGLLVSALWHHLPWGLGRPVGSCACGNCDREC